MTSSISAAVLQQSTQAQTSGSFAASSASSQQSSLSAISSKPLVSTTSTPISPRIIVDPQAGLITQFLNSAGTLEAQIPSAAAVAYLKAGLTVDGQPKPSTTPHPTTTDTSHATDTTNLSSTTTVPSDILA